MPTGLGPDRNQTYEGLFPAAPASVSAFVAIQRGCDKKCSYCIVPTTRGPSAPALRRHPPRGSAPPGGTRAWW
jgi:hypothetical protein